MMDEGVAVHFVIGRGARACPWLRLRLKVNGELRGGCLEKQSLALFAAHARGFKPEPSLALCARTRLRGPCGQSAMPAPGRHFSIIRSAVGEV